MAIDNRPFFSVVVPLYNKERHIVDAVESVLRQSYEKFEIIIVNDGSIDNSLNKLKVISDPRVKIISQENAGVSAARNKGILNSRFDYIAFLDADDEWEPFYLQEISELINEFSDNGWYATGYALKENGRLENLIPKELENKKKLVDFFQYSIFNLLIHIDSTVIRKSSFEKVGFFPIGVTHGEDQDLFARLALKYPLAYSGKVGTHYSLDSDNRACKNVKLTELWPFLKENNELLQHQKLTDEQKFYIHEYVAIRMISRARALKNNGKTLKSIQLLMRHKNTVLFKKMWIQSFIICLLPNQIFKVLKSFLLRSKL